MSLNQTNFQGKNIARKTLNGIGIKTLLTENIESLVIERTPKELHWHQIYRD